MALPLSARARRLGKDVYFGSLRTLGVTGLKRRFQDAGLVLCYHNVVGDDEADAGDLGLHVPRERFESHMRWLVERYTVLPLDRFIDRLVSGSALRSIAAVTFDDGYAGVFEHAAPILSALAIPATVFLVAGAVGTRAHFPWDGTASHQPADWSTVRAGLRHGIAVGAHSITHPSLPALTDAQLQDEIVGSREILHQATGVRPEFFAYPFGRWDARVRAAVEAAGYRAGFTLDYGLNGSGADPWAIRRVNVPAAISDRQLETWAGGFHRLRRAG